jgi:signal peptidase I
VNHAHLKLGTAPLVVSIILILLVISNQISVATSAPLRICSSFEKAQYASNSSGEIWYVASDSMAPLLTIGDIVAVESNVSFQDVRIDDIILFKEPVSPQERASTIISRVSEILMDPHNESVLLTRGDANSGSIPGIDFPIYENNFMGIVNCFLEEGRFKH